MNHKKRLLTAGLMTLAATTLAHAGEKEDAIIAKVTAAYGGDALTTARSITIIDYNKSPWPGQGGSAKHPDFFRNHAELTIDFEGKRKSMLSWRISRTAKDLDRFVYDGKDGRVYDILNHKYTDDSYYSYETIGQAVVTASDTMIARSLWRGALTATHVGETPFRGAIHDKLAVKSGSGAAYELYVSQSTGLISKLARQHPRAGEIGYIFSNHRTSGGVTYAQDMNMFVGGEPRRISTDRYIEMNPAVDALFLGPAGYESWGEIFDTSKMQVRILADGVYQAGKGRSFPIFVDAGDYFIAAGGEAGLKESFAALQQQIGSNKPLKYMIFTHHHREHIGPLAEAVELGATIVTVSEHQKILQDTLSEALPSDRFALVEGKASFGDGVVNIYDIATAHSEHYLLVHLPTSKIVFGEDHFGTELKTAVPRVHKDMVTFGKIVESLGIEVERFIDGHGPRILSKEEFQSATEAYRDVTCPVGYRICAKG